MERSLSGLPQTEVSTVPVTKESLSNFQRIYNEKMRDIPAARYMTTQRADSLLQKENCYFVYRDNEMIGIGITSDGMISALASLRQGAGEDVVLALCRTLSRDRVRLEVAEENKKAIRLYSRLGFENIGVENIWYKVL
jgi:ribosomal protein S18 acetylase RimI-like enzyme